MPDLRVVRALRSSKVHVIRAVSIDEFNVFSFMSSPFVGIVLPAIVECGVRLTGRNSAAVCMEPGTKVTCAPCRRLTNILVADSTNNLINGRTAQELWDMIRTEQIEKVEGSS